jgi:signal peptidase I
LNAEPKTPAQSGTIKCSLSEFYELGKEVLNRGHALKFSASGRSMHPVVQDGDTILVQPVDARALRTGDIALCRTASGTVVHRVLRVKRTHEKVILFVKGDRSLETETVVVSKDRVGRVVSVYRGGKTIRLDSRWSRAGGVLLAEISKTHRYLYPLVRTFRKMLRLLHTSM